MSNMPSDPEKNIFLLGISEELKKEYHPILDMALFALTNILRNEHLQKNFSAHFIPIELYQYDFPV